MRKSLVLLLLVVFGLSAMAQTVKTVGATGADYATLKEAFDAINAGSLTSPVELQIIDNTTETAAAVLSKTGVAVTIYPTVTGKSISGTVAGNLIQLGLGNNNIVSNVIIDGRLRNSSGVLTGSTPDLTIENTEATGTSTSTVLFNNGSNGYVTNSRLTYCIVKGSSQRGEGSGGMIHINGGHASQTGIEISYNKITASNGVRPINAVWLGANTTGTRDVKIVSNDFEDVVKTNGIRLHNQAYNFEISGNSFYETVPFTPSTAYNFVQTGGSNTGGINGVISGNFMGGSSAECEGMLTTTGSFNQAFRPININNVQIKDGITISNNTIKNIAWTTNGNSAFNGIWFQGHLTSNAPNSPSAIYGNFIANIFYTNSTGAIDIYGINYNQKNVNIYNNVISLGSNHRATVYGIRLSVGSYNVLNIVNVYNNTVYIQGEQPGTGNENSFAFHSTSNAITRDIRNNIFYNARTRLGGSGKHYAAYLGYTAMVPDPNTNNVSFTCDYNDYYVTGTGSVMAYANSDMATLDAFKAITGQDANSLNTSPGISAPGTTLNSYKGTVALIGQVIAEVVTVDIHGNSRLIGTNMGAFEVNGDFTATKPVQSDVTVYQNNTHSIAVESIGGATIRVYNLAGMSVAHIVSARQFETISLERGIYIVSVIAGSKVTNLKMQVN